MKLMNIFSQEKGIIKNSVGNIEFIVQPTQNRLRSKGDFIAKINKKYIDKTFYHDYVILQNSINGKKLKIQAKIIFDKQILDRSIKIDQKLRDAIGIEIGQKVELIPIIELKNNFLYNKIRNIFGVQYNIVRVKRSFQNDMEINLCRVSKESLESIGVKPGDTIVIQSTNGTVKLRSVEFSDKFIELLNIRERNKPEIYPNCNFNFANQNSELDILPIFLDKDARDKLFTKSYKNQIGFGGQCAPVRISRSLAFVISKQIGVISITTILAAIGAVVSIDIDDSMKLLILFIGLIFVAAMQFYQIKQKV